MKLFKVHIDFLCGGVRPSFKSVITDLKYRGLVRWNANLDLRCTSRYALPAGFTATRTDTSAQIKQRLYQ